MSNSNIKLILNDFINLVDDSFTDIDYRNMYIKIQTIGGYFFTQFLLGDNSSNNCIKNIPIINLTTSITKFNKDSKIDLTSLLLQLQNILPNKVLFTHLLTPGHYALLIFDTNSKTFYEFDASHHATFSELPTSFINYIQLNTGYEYNPPTCPNYANIMSIQYITKDTFCMMWGALIIYCICHLNLNINDILLEFNDFHKNDKNIILNIIYGFIIYCYNHLYKSEYQKKNIDYYYNIRNIIDDYMLNTKDSIELNVLDFLFLKDPISYIENLKPIPININDDYKIKIDKSIDPYTHWLLLSIGSYFRKLANNIYFNNLLLSNKTIDSLINDIISIPLIKNDISYIIYLTIVQYLILLIMVLVNH